MKRHRSGFSALPRRTKLVRVSSDRGWEVEVPWAGTYLRRLVGLLFGGEMLLLHPCSSVHGFGLRSALDVAYIDRCGTVVDLARLKPWRAHRPRRGAVAVWEAPAGCLEELGLSRGDVLSFTEA